MYHSNKCIIQQISSEHLGKNLGKIMVLHPSPRGVLIANDRFITNTYTPGFPYLLYNSLHAENFLSSTDFF